jgi:ketosteroid isomerase-like protein
MQTSSPFLIRAMVAVIVGALGPVAAAFGAPGGGFNHPADVKAISDIERKLATLATMKDLIQHYAPDAIVYDAYAPGVYKGTKQIYTGFETQFEQSAGFTGQIKDMNILAHGNFACAALQLRFDYKMKDGSAGTLTMRQLDAYKKIGGRWLIIQQHISFPFDPTTGMGLQNAPMPVRGPLKWAANSFASPAVTPAQASREIHQWLEVGGISPNLDALMKYYGPTDDVLVYNHTNSPAGEFRGLQEIRAGFAAVMNFTNPKIEIVDFAVESDGVFAVQIDTQNLTITPQGGSEIKFRLRQSDCMRRVNGQWYSVFEALSVPVDAKTGKALTSPITSP